MVNHRHCFSRTVHKLFTQGDTNCNLELFFGILFFWPRSQNIAAGLYQQ